MEEGFIDAHGVLIYYAEVGNGAPLMIVHGGPGASHDYFLPYLLPLARRNHLIFIDERGSGKSEKLEDPGGYTVENMVEDVEAVRQGLNLGKISLLGHSYGGVLAEAYALKYQKNLTHLILCSTFYSTSEMNQALQKVLAAANPQTRQKIAALEKDGLYGKGKPWEKGRYTADYMALAWGDGYFPYLYQKRPDPNYDPAANGAISWDLYRENVGFPRRVRDRWQSEIGGVWRSVEDHRRADADRGGRPRRMRPGAIAGDAAEDRRVETSDSAAERAYDICRPAGAVSEGGRGVLEVNL